MKELKVKQVIIGKQFENCENLEEFLKIIKEKNIKLNVVEAGNKINIEKNLYFDVLWPSTQKSISENSINNNALVCNLHYKNFTCLYTGDIEKEAEEEIVKLYSKTDKLNATILKVAHHGSKSSSTESFLELVNPQIALIGVGKNNLYGHPNEEVLKRLQNLRSRNFKN